MVLVVCVFGIEVFRFEIGPQPAAEDDAAALSGGLLGSTPVGFTAKYERPDESDIPDRE